MKQRVHKRQPRTTREKVRIIAAVFALLVAGFVLWSAIQSLIQEQETSGSAGDMPMGVKGRLSLTSFDRQLGKKMMDKDNDGACDSCGMPIEMCLETGQLQCNMDSKSTIGVLDSDHIHADWKIYINGKALDLADKAHMERMQAHQSVSSFIHVDSGSKPPEKTGDVLHMHATDVPLWVFFESLGMELERECLTLETGEKFCSNEKKSLKFSVNGQPNNQYEQYVFRDGDKILVSYGDRDEDVQKQSKTITDFAQNH